MLGRVVKFSKQVVLCACLAEFDYSSSYNLNEAEVIFFYHMRSNEGIFYDLWKVFEEELSRPYSILPLVRHSSDLVMQKNLAARRQRVLEEVHAKGELECTRAEDSTNGKEVITRHALTVNTKSNGEYVLWRNEKKKKKKKANSKKGKATAALISVLPKASIAKRQSSASVSAPTPATAAASVSTSVLSVPHTCVHLSSSSVQNADTKKSSASNAAKRLASLVRTSAKKVRVASK